MCLCVCVCRFVCAYVCMYVRPSSNTEPGWQPGDTHMWEASLVSSPCYLHVGTGQPGATDAAAVFLPLRVVSELGNEVGSEVGSAVEVK